MASLDYSEKQYNLYHFVWEGDKVIVKERKVVLRWKINGGIYSGLSEETFCSLRAVAGPFQFLKK